MKVIYLGKEVELEDGIIGFNAVKALDPERRKEALAFKVGERIYDMNQVVRPNSALAPRLRKASITMSISAKRRSPTPISPRLRRR